TNIFLDNGGINTLIGGPGSNTVIPAGGTNIFQAAAGTTPLTVTATDATRVYGAANPAFAVGYSGFLTGDSPSSLGGTLSVTPPAPAASDTGAYRITPSGLTSGKYTIFFVDGTLTISPANQTITWPTPASIIYGTALSGTQLDATVSVVGPAPAGAPTYSPA